jgi:hypothetical protein
MRDPERWLRRALAGDEEALESVLEGVVTPLFDLAFHLARAPGSAGELVVQGLRELARCVRGGGPLELEPLLLAARAVVAAALALPPAAQAGEHGLDALPAPDRLLLTVRLALEASPREVALILGIPEPLARARAGQALAALGQSARELREELDALAARHPLPRGLVDQALDGT